MEPENEFKKSQLVPSLVFVSLAQDGGAQSQHGDVCALKWTFLSNVMEIGGPQDTI